MVIFPGANASLGAVLPTGDTFGCRSRLQVADLRVCGSRRAGRRTNSGPSGCGTCRYTGGQLGQIHLPQLRRSDPRE
jgi:hypothetical protein